MRAVLYGADITPSLSREKFIFLMVRINQIDAATALGGRGLRDIGGFFGNAPVCWRVRFL